MFKRNRFNKMLLTEIILVSILILTINNVYAFGIQPSIRTATTPSDLGLNLPFTAGQTWAWTTAPHKSGIASKITNLNGSISTHYGGTTINSGLDFASYGAVRNIVAAAPGYVHVECYTSKWAIVNILQIPKDSSATSGDGTAYLHVKIDTNKIHDGVYLQRGDIIGTTITGAFSDRCGSQTNAHVHWGRVTWSSKPVNGKIDYKSMTYWDQSMDNIYMGGWLLQKRYVTASEVDQNTGSKCTKNTTQWVLTWRDQKSIKCKSSDVWNNIAQLVGDGRAPSDIGLALPTDLETINATQDPTSVNFSWTKHNSPWNNPVDYQLQVSNSADFVNPEIDTSTNSINTNVLLNIGGSQKNYYWRVRGSDLNGTGPWTTIRQLTIIPSLTTPSLIHPSDNATVNPDFTFNWNTSNGATEYYAEYSGTTTGNSGWITGTSFPVTSLPVGSYTWHVKARNIGGESPWSTSWTFTVQPVIVAPPAPTLVSPVDAATLGPDFTFDWNIADGASEYYAEYSGAATGNSGWITGTSFAVTSMPAGIYTWHVKARNSAGESAWSTSRSFTVQSVIVAPPAPTLVSPVDTVTVNPDLNFTWNANEVAIEYYLEYAGTSSGNSGWISTTSYPVTSLPTGSYSWHVKARNSAGESAWSTSWTFTVQPAIVAPPPPTLVSPVDVATVNPDFTFSWDNSEGATEYYLDYSGVSSGNSGWISTISFPVTSLPVGIYSWHVKARNSAGESAWSASWTFTVEPAIVAPPAPTLISPADNETIVGTSVNFSWNDIVNATEYYIDYYGASSGNSGWINATTFTATSLPAGTYTWRVMARNAAGESPWSLTRIVNIVAVPSPIQINSPTTLYPTYTTTNCPTSNWMRSTNSLGHYYYFTQNNNVNPWVANPNYGYWKGTIPVGGKYKIEFYVPSHGTFYWCGTGGKAISANTTDAHYQIYTSGSTWTKVEKSQNVGGNVWVNLGTFTLTAGNYNIVKLIDSNHQTSFSQLIFFSDIRITWVSQ